MKDLKQRLAEATQRTRQGLLQRARTTHALDALAYVWNDALQTARPGARQGWRVKEYSRLKFLRKLYGKRLVDLMQFACTHHQLCFPDGRVNFWEFGERHAEIATAEAEHRRAERERQRRETQARIEDDERTRAAREELLKDMPSWLSPSMREKILRGA